MLIFPDPNVETEYTDPNGSVWEFNGTGWVRQCASDDDGGGGGGQASPYVEFVLNGDDAADGSQDIVDVSGRHNISIYSDVYVSTSEKKFGTGSLDFTKGNGYLSIGFSPDLTLNQNINVPYTTSFKGGSPFTIEGWFKVPDVAVAGTLLSSERRTGGQLNRGWYIFLQNGGVSWQKSHDGKNTAPGSATTISGVQPNQWHHFACTWDGENYRQFLDGVTGPNVYQSDLALMSSNVSSIVVGARLNSSNPADYTDITAPLNGYMDDVMVTMGVCKYTEDFTPPGQIQISSVRSQEKKRSFVHKVDLEVSESIDDDADLSELNNNVTTEE